MNGRYVENSRGPVCGHGCVVAAAATFLLAWAQSTGPSTSQLRKLRRADDWTFLRTMRPACSRLPPLLSPCHRRCPRFFPKLGLEVLRDDCMAHHVSVAFDEPVPGWPPCALCASVTSLSARQHSLFLCRQLLGKIDPYRSQQTLRGRPRRYCR